MFKETNEIFAMKILKKKHLIQTHSVDNTIAEKDILRKVDILFDVFFLSSYFRLDPTSFCGATSLCVSI